MAMPKISMFQSILLMNLLNKCNSSSIFHKNAHSPLNTKQKCSLTLQQNKHAETRAAKSTI